MTTDEMILALVATGKFTLPEGLEQIAADPLNNVWGVTDGGMRPTYMSDQKAHDLCACHFAREARAAGGHLAACAPDIFQRLWLGDSAAAIEALWRATQ